MEVYKKIKEDLGFMLFALLLILIISNAFDFGIDSTDKDGMNRSGVTLVTDYGTGLQYLYKGGSLIPRLDKNGNHVGIKGK